MDLAELRERLEKATGGDREIDAAIFVAVEAPEQYSDDLRRYRLPHPSLDEMDMCAPGTYWLVQRSGRSLRTSPHYTASLDAIVSLIERKLPGWGWSAASGMSDANLYGAALSPLGLVGAALNTQTARATTPPLALCIALVKAMEAQANEPASESSK
jgi:hypothetical protein